MSKTILIVDDSATMIMSVKSNLEMNGFKVETAGDGVQALSKLKAGIKPDLIITDINMPNMDGVTLVKQLRAQAKFKSTPILILTTEGGDDKKQQGKDAGATGWIVKPFAPDKLLQVIGKVCP